MSKIALALILRSPEGGIRKHVVDILEGLPVDKYRKIFITDMNSTDRDLDYLRTKFGVTFFNLNISDQPSLNDVINLFKIFLFLRKEQNLVLHGHGAKGGLYARVCSLMLRCPSIYTPHGGSLHRVFGKFKAYIFDTVEKLLIPLTSKFVFESKYSAMEFKKHIGNCAHKSIVNYNGVSFSDPCKITQYKKGDKIRIASFGLLRRLKGHDIAIDALAILKRQGIKFSYTIYGYGEEKANLLNQIKKLELVSEVQIKDFCENIMDEMQTFDVILHPSRFESFGYVPLEAMSIKVPVITSFEGGLKEIYIEDGTLLAKNNTAEEYAILLQQIYRGELNLVDLTEKAFDESKKRFSVDVMIEKLDTIYQSLSCNRLS